MLFALGNGLMWPSVLAVWSKTAESRDQGALQGVAGSVGSAASHVGLVAGGLLYGSIGERTFVVSAAVTLLVCALSFLLRTSNDGRPRWRDAREAGSRPPE